MRPQRIGQGSRRNFIDRLAILPTTEAMVVAFADFLKLDVANGDAPSGTVNTYERRLNQYLKWCSEQGINPAFATPSEIKSYRHYLIQEKGQKPTTIALTLSVIRRFYTAALNQGLVKETRRLRLNRPEKRLMLPNASPISKKEN